MAKAKNKPINNSIKFHCSTCNVLDLSDLLRQRCCWSTAAIEFRFSMTLHSDANHQHTHTHKHTYIPCCSSDAHCSIHLWKKNQCIPDRLYTIVHAAWITNENRSNYEIKIQTVVHLSEAGVAFNELQIMFEVIFALVVHLKCCVCLHL